MTPKRHLLNIKGITEAKVEKIFAACNKLSGRGMFASAQQCLLDYQTAVFLTTGSSAVDEILGGGIETGSITELYGEFRTGMTQICHTLCVTAQLPTERGGCNGKVLYIDTENTFRPQRVKQIASERFGLDGDEVLENIAVAQAATSEQQVALINHATALFAEEGPYRLMIIDSIIANFRAEYIDRGDLTARQQLLSQHLRNLKMLAMEFKIAIVCVSQVTADPGTPAMFGPLVKPVSGNIMAHATTTRVHLKKTTTEQRIAKMFDSPCMPEADTLYVISSKGRSLDMHFIKCSTQLTQMIRCAYVILGIEDVE